MKLCLVIFIYDVLFLLPLIWKKSVVFFYIFATRFLHQKHFTVSPGFHYFNTENSTFRSQLRVSKRSESEEGLFILRLQQSWLYIYGIVSVEWTLLNVLLTESLFTRKCFVS